MKNNRKPIKRKQLQKKAESRLRAIKLNYDEELYDEVVSDSGLVIEFALKSAVCKTLARDEYPEHISNYRTHDPNKLIKLSKLKDELEKEKASNIDFFINWSLLSKWSIDFRYMPPGTHDEKSSADYIKAIESEEGGVYPWIKKRW